MNSALNAAPNQAATEAESNVKMEGKPSEDTKDELPKKEEEKAKSADEEKPAKASDLKEEQNAAAALTSLHESTKETKEEPLKKDKKEDDDEEEDEEDDEPRDDSDFVIPLKLTKSGRKRATPFPLKLMKTLANPEFKDIISWTESGKAFNILQPKLFTAQVLPEYFKTAKYSSFTRKLHRWGFLRHYRGPESGSYYHKFFRRGRMDLVEKMTCSKPSGTPPSSSKTSRAAANARDNAPAMSMIMDTSASSRDSAGFRANGMMGNALGLPQLQAGPGGFNALMQQQQIGAMGGIPQQFLVQGFGGIPQQQMFFQQQQGGNPSGDSGLDAAIEMEVTRRLKERINAAAFSRPTLTMMQQQGGGGTPNQMQQAQGQMQHPNMMQHTMMGGAGRAMFPGGGPMGSPSLQGFPQGFKGFDHNQGTFMNAQDPYGMPSNIQGANTA